MEDKRLIALTGLGLGRGSGSGGLAVAAMQAMLAREMRAEQVMVVSKDDIKHVEPEARKLSAALAATEFVTGRSLESFMPKIKPARTLTPNPDLEAKAQAKRDRKNQRNLRLK